MTDNDMTDLRKAAEMALEFVSSDRWGTVPYMDGAVFFDAIELQNALRAALEQPKEVVECLCGLCKLERP